MIFSSDSNVFKGAQTSMTMMGATLPYVYTSARDEYLAGRESAWLGITLNVTPIYVLSGPDAATLLNRVCVNRDFSLMQEGMSKHALICNENGHLIADGVIMKEEGTVYRTYWLAPVLEYYVTTSGLDVQGTYVQDEYFFQIDGPKSLEILEEATQTDLHDIKFAKNKKVQICGTEMTVHRLGMSGCLAYEVHGKAEYGEKVYTKIRDVLESYGGRPQGIGSYGIINHTTAGYPNQMQHFLYPYEECNPELGAFMKQRSMPLTPYGSNSDYIEDYYVYPYDIGWGYLINYNHDFIGKEALLKVKSNQPRKVITLEWNADDVADVFASNFRGKDVEPYDSIETPTDGDMIHMLLRGDQVLKNGQKIGMAVGRTWAYYERRMISLAYIKPEFAIEGEEVVVLWGDKGHRQKEIRAKVAPFPYYNGDFRNETFDTEKIPRRF
ncbi:aminomethyltransferase family protein [Marvinbryantia formatexigens]|nr:aminomethyltransferase family protein [Marvinbryantia formatexigens]UWO24314.1 aminomethyltransferase family protein [Marvinbryantia formatexigens DSM 14469]SDF54556.1 Glycine cleavage system T protein (aminomethyltransferase) [Marvinbryantia formatexigens]